MRFGAGIFNFLLNFGAKTGPLYLVKQSRCVFVLLRKAEHIG